MKDGKLFDNRPTVKKPRLNLLPPNPQQAAPESAVSLGRFPSWLHRPLPKGNNLWMTGKVLTDNRLHTVCEEARCPNLLECWSKKTATFLALGKECTRNCGFCSIDFSRTPKEIDRDEPERIVDAVQKLGLKHVVITMVARDDLPNGGAEHMAEIVEAIHKAQPEVSVEVLTSDFQGSTLAWDIILASKPAIFNHNIETVRALVPRVRHRATYDRTLELLAYVSKEKKPASLLVKSGLMVGLGETENQVYETLTDLKNAGCHIVTIGQYLQPNHHKLLVKSFVSPEQFKKYEEYGLALGIQRMHAGPFVRSSYNAAEFV